jgi:hypothetical protein
MQLVVSYLHRWLEAAVELRLSPPEIECIGEISEFEKNEFLRNALALLFTINWRSPSDSQ